MRLSYNVKMVLLGSSLLLPVFYILFILIDGRQYFLELPWYLNVGIYLGILIVYAIIFIGVKPWMKGSVGEAWVRGELKKLPKKEYLHIADFHKNRKGNADFVVIGPTGIYTIEVKNTKKGLITSHNDNLCINGSLFEGKDPLKQSYAEAMEIQNYLRDSLNIYSPVTPVLVFANPKVKMTFGREKQRGVFVIGINWVNKIILEENRDEKLTPEVCNKIKENMNKYGSDIV
jgi:hypothetical protein